VPAGGAKEEYGDGVAIAGSPLKKTLQSVVSGQSLSKKKSQWSVDFFFSEGT
jgi:hypothetical protein